MRRGVRALLRWSMVTVAAVTFTAVSATPKQRRAIRAQPTAPPVGQMEDGVAITNPDVLAYLEDRGFAAGSLLFPENPQARFLSANNLFTGRLRSVGTTLIQDIEQLPPISLDSTVRAFFATVERPERFRFSAKLLTHPESGFVLTGIVNRMDRAYRVVDGKSKLPTCGELRFLYRFTYKVMLGGATVASRLPFTMAIVMNMRAPDETLTCAAIAQRWQKLQTLSTAAEVSAYLNSADGPLKYVSPSQVDRIEANLQLFRVPAGGKTDFGGHAEYLLRIFRRASPDDPFVVTRLENQVNREGLLGSTRLREAFRTWLFSDAVIADIDTGVLDMPWQFLATRAISTSPGGVGRTANDPIADLINDADIRSALDRYQKTYVLQRVKSVEGFRRRLADFSCSGCHQVRAIAGFHFTGADPGSEPAANAVHVPASAHFLADVPRRRGVIAAFAIGRRPDFSRGFSGRPDQKFFVDLASTNLADGWAAACYETSDRTFRDWTCRAGLTCKVLGESPSAPGAGTCVTADAVKIGDPMEFGVVSSRIFGDDSYTRKVPSTPAEPEDYHVPPPPSDRGDYVVSHQGFRLADLTGGFPAGMLRIAGCDSLPSEAACGRVAVDGFNKCVADGRPFQECLKFTALAGLRACDRANPCREDYICTAPYADLQSKAGTCIPPYFMFQFRVDGHPSSFSVPEEFFRMPKRQ